MIRFARFSITNTTALNHLAKNLQVSNSFLLLLWFKQQIIWMAKVKDICCDKFLTITQSDCNFLVVQAEQKFGSGILILAHYDFITQHIYFRALYTHTHRFGFSLWISKHLAWPTIKQYTNVNFLSSIKQTSLHLMCDDNLFGANRSNAIFIFMLLCNFVSSFGFAP